MKTKKKKESSKRKKKLRLGDPEIWIKFINKQLKPYKVTYEDVLKTQVIRKKPWYEHYTFENQQAEDNFKEWAIEWLQEHVTPRPSKELCRKQISGFILMWGLKIKHK